MLSALSETAYRWASRRLLLLLLGLYVAFPAYLLPKAEQRINELAGKKVGIIDLLPGYQPDRLWQMLSDYGTEARAYYARTEATTDIAYPITYTLLFVVILSLLYRHKPYRPFAIINLLPLGILGFDIAENIGIITLLHRYPDIGYSWAVATAVCTTGKWLMLLWCVLAIVYGLLRLLLPTKA